MTNPNLTEIAVISDNSGSMEKIKNDMIGGFNTFIEEQKKIEAPCVVSLYNFSTVPRVVFEEVDIHAAPVFSMAPTGGTALYDACFFAIEKIGQRLASKPEEQRPGKVIIMILTDGEENSSKEHTHEEVKAKIQHQQEAYDWQFIFMGANIDSAAVAVQLGVRADAAQDFTANAKGVQDMYSRSSAAIGGYRKSTSRSARVSFDPKKQGN